MKCSSSKSQFHSQSRWLMAALTVAISITSTPVSAQLATWERLSELQSRGNGDRKKVALSVDRASDAREPLSTPALHATVRPVQPFSADRLP